LELYALALRDADQREDSKKVLLQCVSLAPNERPNNWMSLGELQDGPDALQSFQRGIHIMSQNLNKLTFELKGMEEDISDSKKNVKKTKLKKDIQKLEKEISSGYVSCAELYMNDLCDEDKAELKCEALLQQAIQICSANAEAHHTLSELRLAQSKTEESIGDQARQLLFSQAIISLQTCLELINDTKQQNSDDFQFSYDFNLKVAMLAMDLKQYKVAARLADKVLKHNDLILEAWAVAGIANLRRGKVRLANLYLKQAALRYEKDEKECGLCDEEKVTQANVALALTECQERIKTLTSSSATTISGENDVEDSSDDENTDNKDNNDDDDDYEDVEMDTEALSNQFHSTTLHNSTNSSDSSSSSTKSQTSKSNEMLDE